MKIYVVTVTANAPAPRRFTYRVEAGSYALAASRAIKMIRKDIPRKRFSSVSVSIIELSKSLPVSDKTN